MAKTTIKKIIKKAPVKAKASKPKKSTLTIESVSEQILDKLKALNVATELQSDINWCLGSYRNDHNPVGLYATSKKALSVLNAAKSKNSRAVSAKLISDIEKLLADN